VPVFEQRGRASRVGAEVVLDIDGLAPMDDRPRRAAHHDDGGRQCAGARRRTDCSERADGEQRVNAGPIDGVDHHRFPAPAAHDDRDVRPDELMRRGDAFDRRVAGCAHAAQFDIRMGDRAGERDGVIDVGADVGVDPQPHPVTGLRHRSASAARSAPSTSGCA